MKLLLVTALLGICCPFSFAQRVITNIQGDLYRFQNNAHYSVFLVTGKGVIATDPINEEAASWLKTQIKQRFNQPVKYVIYSHHHADHISGGQVFDEAVFVGHSLTKEAITQENIDVPLPQKTFDDKMTLILGGKVVKLFYPGKSHSDNGIIMLFPQEKTVFAVDFISIKRLPYRTLNNSFFPDWMEAIKKVEALDFEVLAPGHGELGGKPEVTEHRKYLEALFTAVKQAYTQGQSLDHMKKTILLKSYQHLGQYQAWREMNIEGVYNFLSGASK